MKRMSAAHMPDPQINIFISYAQPDSAFVELLKADISQQRFGTWSDRHALPVGQRWRRSLQAALDRCQVLLVVLSSEGVASEEVQSEYSYAGEEGKVVIPLSYRPCKVPLALRSLQRINFQESYEQGLAALVQALQQVAKTAKSSSKPEAEARRPSNYIPFPRNPLFQPRPGEFEQLENMLFGSGAEEKATHLGLVGMVGLGGVGKTQLAIELAYRYLHRFPAGVFWMPATGTNVAEWQHQLAILAANTEYLPPDDNISNPENEARRARHFCRYLANHTDALLILDNVEDPNLVTTALPALAGGQLACSILYTSRIRLASPGIKIHSVEQLSEESALRLLLETTRPSLLSEALTNSQTAEASAARAVCHAVGYLPLALTHLRGLLARDQRLTLVRLAEVLKQRGALEIEKKTQPGDAARLFTTFRLSWEKVHGEDAQRLFKLASYFPEVAPIPRWLLGVAADLGEGQDIFEPLGEACAYLQELSLMEELSGDQVRLHPLVREFGRRLVAEDGDKGKTLLEEAEERLTNELGDLNRLEQRAQRESYMRCLEQVRAARKYADLLLTGPAEQLARVEHWLDRESFLFADGRWWPQTIPGLFYQQLFNRSTEEGHPLTAGKAPARWLRQLGQVGAENRSLLRRFMGHSSSVLSVAFSPDGSKVLTGSADRTARLWETASGRELVTFRGHSGSVVSVAFSPDGSKVLTGSGDWTARLWETASGRELMIFRGHADAVTSLAFSPHGTKVLTGSNDETARLWETASGQELVTFRGHLGFVSSVAVSPDGSKVLTGSNDYTARLWETASGRELLTLLGHTDYVNSVTFSPDATKMLTGSGDDTACLWETASGQELVTFRGHLGFVSSVAFSPDGSKVLTGSADRTARLWETASGRELMILRGHSSSVKAVAFSPDGSMVLTGSADRTAGLWVWETLNGQELTTVQVNSGSVWSVAFSPDDTKVLTGSADQTARLWETASGRELITFQGHSDYVRCVVFSPDGTKVLTGSDNRDRTARLWETASGQELITLRGHTGSIRSVAFSPDGSKVLTGSADGTARLWEAASGNELITLRGHSGYVTSAAFSPNGAKLLTGSVDQTARLWETVSGQELIILHGHADAVTSVAFSPDGSKVLTGSADRTARLWATANGSELTTLRGHSGYVTSVAFSPNGAKLLTGSLDQTARLWETVNGQELIILHGHAGSVTSVAFSPDGSKVLTGSADQTARLWETVSGQELITLYSYSSLKKVIFSPDGRFLIICNDRGQMHLFQASGVEMGSLQGMYVATYEVGAVHWHDSDYLLLADMGGPRGRPYLYRLKLEGKW